MQADSTFWKKKLDKPTKKTRTKSKATKKPVDKNSNPSEPFNLDDDDDDDDDNESEVELDSLAFVFMQLINVDSSQDDAENSHVDTAELTIISPDLEPLTRQKNSAGLLKSKIFLSSWLSGSQFSFEETTARESASDSD